MAEQLEHRLDLPAHRVEEVMGMPVSIVVHDACSAIALDEAFALLRAVDATFSTYRPDSEISRIAAGSVAPPDASDEVQQVLALCEDMQARTGGFFDVRAGGRLDPSGVVKGWAVERAARLLSHAGARRFCVNAGGDVVVRGGERRSGNDPCGSHPWRVGIQHPVLRERLCCVIEMNDGAVATSGTYERGPHIVDPHTGSTPDHVLSVTVLGPDLATADAYATAAFAMGEAGPAWTASLRDYHAMTILADGRVLCTPGFLAYCPGGSPAASLDVALPSGMSSSYGTKPSLAAGRCVGHIRLARDRLAGDRRLQPLRKRRTGKLGVRPG